MALADPRGWHLFHRHELASAAGDSAVVARAEHAAVVPRGVLEGRGVKQKNIISQIFQRNSASGVSKTDAAYRREVRGRIIVPIR